MKPLEKSRLMIRNTLNVSEGLILDQLIKAAPWSDAQRKAAQVSAATLVENIRRQKSLGLMEVFLAEYGLSTDEGVALMCLAEALLRVPDTETMDALIEDKIAASSWSEHLGQSTSPLVNASTWALMFTGKVLQMPEPTSDILRGTVKRLGEPVIRMAVRRAMKILGGQFVLGETIDKAIERGQASLGRGYTYSYDMLGEAALTARDAAGFMDAYENAILAMGKHCKSDDIRENPGISIKLSALHPRYEFAQKKRVMDELVPRALYLAKLAKTAGMGFNIDAEEADRLDLSLDVIEAVLRSPDLQGLDGFGVVVQAYGKRALPVIEWLYQLAKVLDRRIMVRLVKGAYWDTEIKRAQVEGLPGFPVFERKAATDISYLCCAQRLLALTDRIYPQFATHNAHSVASILEMTDGSDNYEFQRLHGMGEALHDQLVDAKRARCRIYAPVGPHKDLLAYLVRRLLENGANSSFVNQIIDLSVPVQDVVADPFDQLKTSVSRIDHPSDLFGSEQRNSVGWDLQDPIQVADFDRRREKFLKAEWNALPITTDKGDFGAREAVVNPADKGDQVGSVTVSSAQAVDAATRAARPWDASPQERAQILTKAADIYEANAGEFFALLTREAGKTPMDAIAEVREAVDFLRYYAVQGKDILAPARGVFTCISPWNFPLAIFTGQIAAALVAGNGVLAKPAEPTPLVGFRAVQMLHAAGVPISALQYLPGEGSVVGQQLTSSEKIDGICFTGSTATAQIIHKVQSEVAAPTAPLIAETGGVNAMIVDSTALPEQAIKDIVASAFQSAGQRCSALRVLYLQEDIQDIFLDMLCGAMDELKVGNPWAHDVDVGPIINGTARDRILTHVQKAKSDGRVIKEIECPEGGHFVGPTVLGVNGIADLEDEIFGPILHVASFKADDIEKVIDDVNARGFGLTFGLHSRIDDRVELVAKTVKAGNIYVNRNQIGAVVGSQPFGGEGLSGTGPKAGGENFIHRFTRPERQILDPKETSKMADVKDVQGAIDRAIAPVAKDQSVALPGPTGESNVVSRLGRGVILCLGPGRDAALAQADAVRKAGCPAVCIAAGVAPNDGIDGQLKAQSLTELGNFHGVVSFGNNQTLRPLKRALANREGMIIPLLAEDDFSRWCQIERHVCVDTTAAGGNATLLAGG